MRAPVYDLHDTFLMNTPSPDTPQSYAERIAIDGLVQLLEDRCGLVIDRNECTPRDDDPPDFRLTIEGIEYGVEVTIVSDGSNQEYAWVDDWLTELKAQVQRRNYQLGRISVTLSERPKLPNPKSRAGRDEIASTVLNIGDHFADPVKRLQPLEISSDGHNAIVLRWVGPGFEPGTSFNRRFESSYTPGTREAVLEAIIKATEGKRAKLTKNGFQLDRSILLLVDQYSFSESQEVIADTVDCQAFREFHSVGWLPSFSQVSNRLYPTLPGRPCKLLWSVRKDWMG